MRRHTRLRDVPDVPGIRLHLADDVMAVCSAAGHELDDPDPALPYWAFAWAGGLAIARYLLDRPDEIAGRTVLDVATGSGLCALVAVRLGAAAVHAVDSDPLAEAAVAVNARANDLRVSFRRADPLADPPPDVEVVLAGDVCYEETMASGMLDWLSDAARNGSRVLLGDPGRRYLPHGLERVAAYAVRTSRELEDLEVKESSVYAIAG